MSLVHLCLVRHGEAAPEYEDPARPLTARGRAQVASVAESLRELRLALDIIYHSGKSRAAETAEILARAVTPPHGVMRRPGLNPNDPVAALVDDLDGGEFAGVMLVGHLPQLEYLTAHLLGGRPGSRAVRFMLSTAVCLTREREEWELRRILQPATNRSGEEA